MLAPRPKCPYKRVTRISGDWRRRQARGPEPAAKCGRIARMGRQPGRRVAHRHYRRPCDLSAGCPGDVGSKPQERSPKREAKEAGGDPIAANETTGAPHAAGRGSEQSISYSFDAALEHRPSTFCSEYGANELVGSDDNSGRIGRRGAESVFRRRSGVNDTKLSTGVRRDGSRVHIGVRSTTRMANCWRPSPRRTLLSSQPQHRRNYRHSGDGHV